MESSQKRGKLNPEIIPANSPGFIGSLPIEATISRSHDYGVFSPSYH